MSSENLESDHRAIAQRLDLFHFQEEAPGMVFWHPNGFRVYRELEEAARAVWAAQGYVEVRTPQILRRAVWEASGHWRHFAPSMFRVDDQAVEAAVKPVSCPGHLYVVGRRAPSYRELPIRMAELGVVHRDEQRGTLQGLLRLRQFTQDDGHVFCVDERQAEDEALRFCRAVPAFYRAFGFEDVSVALSTRPPDRAGDDALWDRAEAALRSVLARLDVPFTEQEGAGAFYGPKLEYTLRDRMGRQWQCGTIQLDLVMPRSFELRYVDADGQKRHPIMLHRALYGSLERFLGVLLEHHGGLPAWLAPVHALIVPLSPEAVGPARELVSTLARRGLRGEVDDELSASLARRVARGHARAIPFQAVLGPRELAAGELALRSSGSSETLLVERAVDALASACRWPALTLGRTQAWADAALVGHLAASARSGARDAVRGARRSPEAAAPRSR